MDSLTETVNEHLPTSTDEQAANSVDEKCSKTSSDNCVDSSEKLGENVNNKEEKNIDGELNADDQEKLEELIEFKIVYNKQTLDVKFNLNSTVLALKDHIHSLTGVLSSMQKLVYKGMPKDEQTLKEAGFKAGAKIMVVGSKLTDVLSVNLPSKTESEEEKATTSATKEPLSRQQKHKKIIEKGVPPDAMPAWKNGNSPLPPEPLYGMCNRSGGKVRLTFKLEADQLWIGTKERTEKISMSSVRTVISEPIDGHDEYHIMGIQLGSTEASRYWIYWVPAQYIQAIKETILGS